VGTLIHAETMREDGGRMPLFTKGVQHKFIVRTFGLNTTKETVVRAQSSFENGLEVIRHNATAFIKKVRDLPDLPDKVKVTFGLKATGEVGNFAVARAGAEASYTVKTKWKREAERKAQPKRGTSRRSGS
jgi:hypothetical protein